MSKLSESEIAARVDKLLAFADSLPIRDRGKNYIKEKIVKDFYDTWQYDDENNSLTIEEFIKNPDANSQGKFTNTYGIVNTAQVNRYLKYFIAFIKKSRLMALEGVLKKLDKLHPIEKAAELSKTLASVTRSELFAKHGLGKIKEPEWNEQLKEIFGAELNFAKEQIYERDPPINPTPSAAAIQAQNPKLKLNITVPQLVYLFKMLNDVKPQIFDIETKTELSNFIAANFITKATKKNGISADSVYNLFSSTEKKDANFWVDMLRKMLEDARKV